MFCVNPGDGSVSFMELFAKLSDLGLGDHEIEAMFMKFDLNGAQSPNRDCFKQHCIAVTCLSDNEGVR